MPYTAQEITNMLQSINAANPASIATLKDNLNNDRISALNDANAALVQSQQQQIEFMRAYKRGKDLYDIQMQMLSQDMAGRLQSDVDTTRRQFEINEYYYKQKTNMLFIMQVGYIAALLCVLPLAASAMGFLLLGPALVICLIIVAIATLIIGWQVNFNYKKRDDNEWNKIDFKWKP